MDKKYWEETDQNMFTESWLKHYGHIEHPFNKACFSHNDIALMEWDKHQITLQLATTKAELDKIKEHLAIEESECVRLCNEKNRFKAEIGEAKEEIGNITYEWESACGREKFNLDAYQSLKLTYDGLFEDCAKLKAELEIQSKYTAKITKVLNETEAELEEAHMFRVSSQDMHLETCKELQAEKAKAALDEISEIGQEMSLNSLKHDAVIEASLFIRSRITMNNIHCDDRSIGKRDILSLLDEYAESMQ